MTTGLIVVDVQPAYDSGCQQIAQSVAQRINNTRKPTTIFWVGEGLTDDTEADVRAYLRDFGARPGKLDQCHFVEKDYAFFRGWMDNDVDDDIIVKVGREMLRTGAASSEALDLSEVLDQVELSTLPKWDQLHLPSFDTRRLTGLAKFETCGGGDRECLAEIELYFSMRGLPYSRLANLVY